MEFGLQIGKKEILWFRGRESANNKTKDHSNQAKGEDIEKSVNIGRTYQEANVKKSTQSFLLQSIDRLQKWRSSFVVVLSSFLPPVAVYVCVVCSHVHCKVVPSIIKLFAAGVWLGCLHNFYLYIFACRDVVIVVVFLMFVSWTAAISCVSTYFPGLNCLHS